MQPSSNKSSKKPLVIGLLTLLLLALAGGIYWYTKNEKTKVLDAGFAKVVSSVDTVQVLSTATLDPKVFETPEFKETSARVEGLLSTICDNISNKDLFPSSGIFKIVKSELDGIRTKMPESTRSTYTYVYLPGAVQTVCKTRGADYVDMLTSYVQTDGLVVADPNARKLLGEYIQSIPEKFTGTISKDSSKADRVKFFLETNKSYLEQLYYPYYIQHTESIDDFLNKPINSLEQSNAVKRQTYEKLQRALKDLGITQEIYQGLLASTYDIKDQSLFARGILEDYKKIIKIRPKLAENFESAAKFEKFLRSGDYKVVLSDPELAPLFAELDRKMLVDAAISSDYADGLNEDWSGVGFFKDEKLGNAVIRIHFAMLLK